MSVTTATDPVKTILDVLTEGKHSGGYGLSSYGMSSYGGVNDVSWDNAGAEPDYIERQSKTEQSVKGRRTEDAVYVYGVDGDFEQFATDDPEFLDDQSVTVDVWTPESWAQANALQQDVLRILRQYVNDNGSQTAWQRIRPGTPSDLRPETHDRSGGHYRKTVDVDLHALR